jgi:benzodiazapine receptor
MSTDSILKLAVSLVLPLAVGAIGGIATAKAIPAWYATLNRPPFNPPNWLFGPVWTILYVIMGISLYLVWIQPPGKIRDMAMSAFFIQLALNFGWSFIFFYYRQLGFALAEIVVMWVCILAMILLFYRVRPLAAYLNIPYLMWVTFATVLNAAYFRLN